MAQAESDPERRTTTLAADATASVENAPVPGPKWERHDRTHLELTLRYPVSEDRTWQAFYFLPESFRLDANTYSKRELFVDFRSYVRFTIPRIELERVPEEARKLAGRLTSGTPDDVVRELKLFSCRVRLAITDEAQAIIDTAGPDGGRRGTAVVDAFVTTGSGALAAIRDVLEPLGQADPEVAKPQPGWMNTCPVSWRWLSSIWRMWSEPATGRKACWAQRPRRPLMRRATGGHEAPGR